MFCKEGYLCVREECQEIQGFRDILIWIYYTLDNFVDIICMISKTMSNGGYINGSKESEVGKSFRKEGVESSIIAK